MRSVNYAFNSASSRSAAAEPVRAPKTIFDHVDAAEEISAGAVHLIDETHTRNAVLVSLAPYGFGLRLYTSNRSKTATAPSSTRKERSTSIVKSTWPGVSMMLMRWSAQKHVVAADVIVMPRSCSCSIQSIVAAPSCTSPILGCGRCNTESARSSWFCRRQCAP